MGMGVAMGVAMAMGVGMGNSCHVVVESIIILVVFPPWSSHVTDLVSDRHMGMVQIRQHQETDRRFESLSPFSRATHFGYLSIFDPQPYPPSPPLPWVYSKCLRVLFGRTGGGGVSQGYPQACERFHPQAKKWLARSFLEGAPSSRG